jgi:NAD-dependent deacetylase
MKKNSSIVVLTGAGISAESGIKTFRAEDGLWEEHRIEDVATPEAFERDPELVQKFYNQRRQPLLDDLVHPNPAHFALARLEQALNCNFVLITQNIDNLHEQAGSLNVLHMHGEVLKMHCKQTQQVFQCNTQLSVNSVCECCNQAGNLRPHIVWFGEMPLLMDEIHLALQNCDLFLSIGTSGNVYPAAGFVQLANQAGARSIEFNLEESNVTTEFDQTIYAKAGTSLPKWVDQFLAENK